MAHLVDKDFVQRANTAVLLEHPVGWARGLRHRRHDL